THIIPRRRAELEPIPIPPGAPYHRIVAAVNRNPAGVAEGGDAGGPRDRPAKDAPTRPARGRRLPDVHRLPNARAAAACLHAPNDAISEDFRGTPRALQAWATTSCRNDG